MLRPFRDDPDFDVFPGRCPGLVCHALSGLPKILRFMEIIIQYQKYKHRTLNAQRRILNKVFYLFL